MDLRSGTLAPSGLELWKVRSTGHQIALREPAKATYLVPVRGRVEVATPRGELRAGPGAALLFGPSVRRTRVVPDGGHYEALALLVPDGALADSLMPDHAAIPPVEAAFATPAASAQEASLRAVITYLFEELAREETPLLAPRRQAHASALVADLVAQVFRERAEEEGNAPGEALAGLGCVRRAEEIMRAAAREPLSIGAVAARVGVSQRALQAAFREHRNDCPRGIFRRIRLEEARSSLLAAGEEGTVTQIAMDLGFTHLGRFAVAYKAAFGESPSATLRRRAACAHLPTRPARGTGAPRPDPS